MARTSTSIAAPADHVYAALADGEHYARWVVGAKDIRAVDDHFPRPGAELHHTVGVGPVEISDSTEVKVADDNRRLVLEARVRPVGRARVEFTLESMAAGETRVIMDEHVLEPAVVRWLQPLVDPLIHARNVATLDKLRRLVESGELGTA